DLCQALKCKKKELCLLEDEFTAVCVSKKELHKSGDVIVPKSKLKMETSKLEEDSKEYDEDEDYDSDYDDDDTDSNEDMFSASNKLDSKSFQSAMTSNIVSSVGSASSGSASSNYKSCTPCPVVKPTFLCGSDNRTYSSLCRLDYHNCIQTSQVTVACKGFCPCKVQDELLEKKQAEADRKNRFMQKYKKTVKLEQEQGKLNKSRQKFSKNSYSNGNALKQSNQDSNGIFSNNNNNIEFSSVSAAPFNSLAPNKDRYYSKNKDYMSMMNKKISSDKQRSHNDVVNTKPILPRDCNEDALESMGNRLLDWFSVVMADTQKRKLNRRRSNNQVHFPGECKAEVQWMFQHLNSDEDNQLSLQELFDLENDRNEKCIKPFIDRCDADKDIFISPDEWCKCFAKSDRPCTAVRRKTGNGLLGSYTPQCDADGYYKSMQCHTSIGLCWCVDKHGVEFANTRTRGKPNCGSFSTRDDNDLDDDDDTDIEGSSDGPLEI
ncbi:unnamed protein product, partial [Allacma fusca]